MATTHDNMRALLRAKLKVTAAKEQLAVAEKTLSDSERAYAQIRLMGSTAFGLSAGGERFVLYGSCLYLLRCVDDVVMRDPEEVHPFSDLN
jgi:hypothetical protein